MNITRAFQKAKHSCLLATDVVARGIDFPAVDWVVQVDAPEDVDTYIHRVGRTARYESDGKAVLFLDPSEEAFVKKLEHKKVPIQRVNVREARKKSIRDQLQTLCFQDSDVKYLGQKAFISYAKSVYLQKDREVFQFDSLDLEGFAASLGLPGTPQIKFQKGDDVKRLKNASRQLLTIDSDTENSDAVVDGARGGRRKKGEVRTKHMRMMERQNQDVLSGHYRKLLGDEENGDEEDEAGFLSVKRVLHGDELDDEAGQAEQAEVKAKVVQLGKQEFLVDSHRREKMLKSKKKLAKYMEKGQKLVFDDDGNPRAIYEFKGEEDFRQEGPAEALRRQFVESETSKVRAADVDDKQLAKEKRREKREKRKARERGGEEPATRAVLPQLGGAKEDDDDDEDPLALLRSLPVGERQGEDEDDGREARPKKKAKTWFRTDDSDDERQAGGKKVIKMDHEPETLEDLEALATGLLEG